MSLLDRIEGSRFGNLAIRPVVAVFFYAVAGMAFVVAVIAFWVAFQQSQRSVNEANRAANAAVAKSNATQEMQQKAQAAQLEYARVQFCGIIKLNAANYPPPTTARGVAFEKAYTELGKTPFLHCFK